MTDIGGIEIKEDDEVEILGRTFVIYIDNSLAGDFVVWQDKSSLMRIYATPNFEIDGIPIQVDYDSYNIALDSYEGKINDYEHYKQITKDKIEKLLKDIPNWPKCDCITRYGTEHEHVEIKGWNFSICSYCSEVVDNKNDGKNNENDKNSEKNEEKEELLNNTIIVDIAFKKITGVSVHDAFAILNKKGFNVKNLDEIGMKYLKLIAEDTAKFDLRDEYLVLLHILIMYSVFKSSAMAYNQTINDMSRELGLEPSEYISVIYKTT